MTPPPEAPSLEAAIVDVVCALGEAAAEDIVERVCSRLASCSRVEVRKLIGELVRRGLLARVPDYERGRMVFRPSPEACRSRGEGGGRS